MEPNPTPKDTVLERIRTGEIAMRPKLYFLVRTIVVVLLALSILCISVLLAGFISFSLRVGGHDSLLSFGPRGFSTFLALFPWPLALADLVLIALLAWLVRYFKFGYRHSAIILLSTAAFFALLFGLGIDRGTSLEDVLFDRAQRGELPGPLNKVYRDEHRHAPEELGVFRGIIVSIDDTSFLMTYDDLDDDGDEHTWTVILPPGSATSTLTVGARVYVAGDADGSLIRAYGVRLLP